MTRHPLTDARKYEWRSPERYSDSDVVTIFFRHGQAGASVLTSTNSSTHCRSQTFLHNAFTSEDAMNFQSKMNTEMNIKRSILLCGLGYFVDVLDIQLFAVLRVQSLSDMNIPPDQIGVVSGYILNMQMVGMLIGAFFWGALADSSGRLKSLTYSVLVFSFATLLCAYVQDPWSYGAARFMAGFGLAGETGAATALIAELSPIGRRGWNVALIGGLGFCGPAFAIVLSMFVSWRWAYVCAGLFGLMLLFLRLNLREAALFEKHRSSYSFKALALIYRKDNILKIVKCLSIGLPLVYCWNILNFFSLEISKLTLADGAVFNQGLCLILFFIGASCGDILGGVLTAMIGSRIKVYCAFLVFGFVVSAAYLVVGSTTRLELPVVYVIYFALGISGGCWAMMTMIFAELFGTNSRATASITLTNIVRSLIVVLTFGLGTISSHLPLIWSVLILGCVTYAIGIVALLRLEETSGKNLDFIEGR